MKLPDEVYQVTEQRLNEITANCLTNCWDAWSIGKLDYVCIGCVKEAIRAALREAGVKTPLSAFELAISKFEK